jgi:amino-acid N-acetyltransferase
MAESGAAPTKKEINFLGDNMGIFTNPEETAVKNLLSASGLPTADLTAKHMPYFFGYASDGELVGVVGLELFGAAALLRSLAVTEGLRGSGLGSRLVEHAERHARDQGVESLYLLTTTAETFFLRRGYVLVPRDEAPAAIKGSTEFAGICPAISAFMVKYL